MHNKIYIPHKSNLSNLNIITLGMTNHYLYIFRHLIHMSRLWQNSLSQSVDLCTFLFINSLFTSKNDNIYIFFTFLVPDNISTKCNEVKRIFGFHSRENFDFLRVNIERKEDMTELINW